MGLDAEHRHLVRGFGAALLGAALLASPAGAQGVSQTGCRLALAFGLDVSASVDPDEYRLQLDGLSRALHDPAVRAALFSGPPVALAAYEWSGRNQQVMVADWTVISGDAALDGFAAAVTGHKRGFTEFPTAIGYALGYGSVLLRHGPACARKVLDVSGDGLTNDGFGPEAAYANFDFRDVTVNGLVVGAGDLELISYYQTRIAHGDDAFVEVANDYGDFERVMKRKLLREIGNDFVADGR